MEKRSRCASPRSIRSPGLPRSCCQAIDPAACPHWRETAIGGAPAADPRADPGSAPPFGHRRLHRWRKERCPGSLPGSRGSPRRRPPTRARSSRAGPQTRAGRPAIRCSGGSAPPRLSPATGSDPWPAPGAGPHRSAPAGRRTTPAAAAPHRGSPAARHGAPETAPALPGGPDRRWLPDRDRGWAAPGRSAGRGWSCRPAEARAAPQREKAPAAGEAPGPAAAKPRKDILANRASYAGFARIINLVAGKVNDGPLRLPVQPHPPAQRQGGVRQVSRRAPWPSSGLAWLGSSEFPPSPPRRRLRARCSSTTTTSSSQAVPARVSRG